MSSKTFVDGQTVIDASWLNDVNFAVYGGMPGALFDITFSGKLTGGTINGMNGLKGAVVAPSTVDDFNFNSTNGKGVGINGDGGGQLTFYNSAVAGGVIVAGAGSTYLKVDSGTGSGFRLQTAGSSYAGAIRMFTNGVERGQLTDTGLNGVAVGATTPSTGAFTTLSASGDITQSSSTARTTYSSSAGNGGLQNSSASNYLLLYGPTHATEANNVNLNSSGSIKLKNTGGDIAVVSSTGLAVTGAISASGAYSSPSNINLNGGALQLNDGALVNKGQVGWQSFAASSVGIGSIGANNLVLATNSTVQATLDTAGNLGLGVTPNAWNGGFKALELNGGSFAATTNGPYILGNAYYGSGGYTYKATGAASFYTQTAGSHNWFTAPSGTAGNAITFTQSLQLGKGTALTLEGATSTAGTGIAFPATQVPSSDPNTLDDYEEGTWTPVLTASGAAFTYTTQVGRYTKKGDEVTLHWNIVVASASGLGAALLKIDGSPFTANSSAGYFSVGSVLFTSLQSAYYHVGVDIGASSSTLTLFGQLAASTSSQTFRSDGIMTSAGSQLIGTITYKV